MAKAISTSYIFTLCGDKNKTVKSVYLSSITGNYETAQINQRALEIAIIANLFEVASTNAKKASDSYLCADCIEHMENLKDDESEISLGGAEKDFLASAWDSLAGKRPSIWAHAKELIRQIAEPKEAKTEEEAKT